MEVVLGFAVGYYLGTRQGRDGLQKALDSAQAIMASQETRRLLGEGLSALESVTAPALDRMGGKSGRSKAALLGSVMDEVLERRSARRAAAAA
ncbi:MAG: hypothetical protein ABSB76_15550 [Streptosporangiaceae bacterium]